MSQQREWIRKKPAWFNGFNSSDSNGGLQNNSFYWLNMTCHWYMNVCERIYVLEYGRDGLLMERQLKSKIIKSPY